MTFGFSSGDTEIFSVDIDNTTGSLYIAGTTNSTELMVPGAQKSIFIALYDGIEIIWIKSINDS